MKEVCKLASLRFSFDGDRRSAKSPNARQMRSPVFPYTARFMSRGCVLDFYPIHKEVYRQVTEPAAINKAAEEAKCAAAYEELSEPKMIDESKDSIEPVKQTDPVKLDEPVKPNDTVKTDDATNNGADKETEKYTEKYTEAKDKNINVNEKMIAFLDKSELSLNNVKTQVNTVQSLFTEIMYKLDSFTSILDIIYNNEERRIHSSQVSTVNRKETKDTVDEILELLQNPAIQGLLRQFVAGIVGKSKTANKPES